MIFPSGINYIVCIFFLLNPWAFAKVCLFPHLMGSTALGRGRHGRKESHFFLSAQLTLHTWLPLLSTRITWVSALCFLALSDCSVASSHAESRKVCYPFTWSTLGIKASPKPCELNITIPCIIALGGSPCALTVPSNSPPQIEAVWYRGWEQKHQD